MPVQAAVSALTWPAISVLDHVTEQVNGLSTDTQAKVARVLSSLEWTPDNIAECRAKPQAKEIMTAVSLVKNGRHVKFLNESEEGRHPDVLLDVEI